MATKRYERKLLTTCANAPPLASIVSVAVISIVTVTAGGAQKTLEILLAVA